MEGNPDEQTIEDLVAEFTRHDEEANVHAQALARTIILRSRPFARAKKKGEDYYADFCQKVGVKDATARKYLAIGRKADWLLPISDHLPACWTTIHWLTVRGEKVVSDLVRRGVLHPEATKKEIKAAIAAPEEDVIVAGPNTAIDDQERSTCVFQVDATSLADEDRLGLFRLLEQDASQYGLKVSGLPESLAAAAVVQREAA